MDIVDILFDLPETLLNFATQVKEFLFKQINIPLTNISFSMWTILAGGSVIIILTALIIKSFVT